MATLTDFVTNETNPYPLDLSVCGSRTTRQSLKRENDQIKETYILFMYLY